jgi:hypothetical protein
MAQLLHRTTQTGDEHIKLIDSKLDWYKKSHENGLGIVADNMNLNPYIARNLPIRENRQVKHCIGDGLMKMQVNPSESDE